MCRLTFILVSIALVGVPFAGCGTSSSDEQTAPKKTASKKKKETTVPIAGKLGTFDEGRIEIPLLKGWRTAVKEEEKGSLARMGTEEFRLPAINFLVAEYPDFETVGSGDLRKFARQRREEVNEEKKITDPEKKIKVEPVTLGKFHGVQYSYISNIKGQGKQDRLFLETVVDGRLYTLELQALQGAREESRPALYTVAKNLKFPKMQNQPTGGSDESEDDADDPDAEKTDDEPAPDEPASEDAADDEMKAAE